MYTVDTLIQEHDNIYLFADSMYKKLVDIIGGEEIDIELFRNAVQFVRNYADKLHHGKEEAVLFKYMIDEIGPTAEVLIKNGMLVEHDLGRLYMMNLSTALDNYEEEKSLNYKLDIICAMSSYIELIKRHIEKENGAVFGFAQRMLSDDIKNKIDDESKKYELESNKKVEEIKYLEFLNKISK